MYSSYHICQRLSWIFNILFTVSLIFQYYLLNESRLNVYTETGEQHDAYKEGKNQWLNIPTAAN